MADPERCVAVIKYRVVQQGQTDGLYDFDGQRITLPEGTKETPSIEEAAILCKGCGLSKVFGTTGIGFAAYNEAVRQSGAFLKQNCGKWKAKVAKGDRKGEMPDSFLPK